MSKDNKREAQPESDLPDQGKAFAQRRQVIRGMASIPVALTLSSGAALANTSSYQCVNSGPEPGTITPDCVGPNETIEGWATGNVAPPGNYVPPDSSPPVANQDVLGSKSCVAWYEEVSPGVPVPTGYRYDYVYKDQGQDKHEYIFIDANGNVVASISGNPLRASCATSFM